MDTAATATATNKGDNNAGCNEDPSVCAYPAAATAAPLLPVAGVTPRQHTGPPLLGVIAYFSSSLDDKDKDNYNNDSFNDSNVIGREVRQRWERIRISDVSMTMTKEEMPRLSNVCHRNQGGNNNDKEADYNGGVQLGDKSPTAITSISSAIL